MSVTFACPSCGQVLMLDDPHVGMQVNCPNCGTLVQAPPGRGTVPRGRPLESPPGAPASVVGAESASFVVEPARTGPRLQRSTSLLDVFDFRFRKYVTPLIVRVTWVAFLVIACLWLATICVTQVMALLPSRSAPTPQIAYSERIGGISVDSESPSFERRPAKSTSGWEFSGSMLWMLLSMAIKIAGTIIAVLWVRVALEGTIVIFNIAETLAEIRNQGKLDAKRGA